MTADVALDVITEQQRVARRRLHAKADEAVRFRLGLSLPVAGGAAPSAAAVREEQLLRREHFGGWDALHVHRIVVHGQLVAALRARRPHSSRVDRRQSTVHCTRRHTRREEQ
jgi:hypothetical protein